jgi:sulfide:quinone oxidoreductase
MSTKKVTKHDVVIVGGGTGGITVAARLKRAGVSDIAIIEPAEVHYYQPLWTLVGGGVSKLRSSAKPMASVMPDGVRWIRDAATGVDPENQRVHLASGDDVEYDWLVMAPGIQLDWSKIDGLTETLGRNGFSSNYRADLAPLMWDAIKSTRSGRAVFSMPAGPIKCAGAPQKIAYLACDYWRREGVLDAIDVHMVLPTPGMFGIKEFADTLVDVAQRYGITVHFDSEVIAVDGSAHTVTIRHNPTGDTQQLTVDVAHIVPPQSAPDWVKASPLADPQNPFGYIEVDKQTLQHPRYRNVFALGDATTTPNSKTGAAIRKQAPVLVANLMAVRSHKPPAKEYDGYASCPLVTARGKCVMAEFNYKMERTPTFPVLDMTKERTDMYLVKKYALPQMYWRAMLKGRA